MVIFLDLLNKAIPHLPQPQTISLFNMALLPHLNTSGYCLRLNLGGQPTIWQVTSDGASEATRDQRSRAAFRSAPELYYPSSSFVGRHADEHRDFDRKSCNQAGGDYDEDRSVKLKGVQIDFGGNTRVLL
uniref:Uncharacterized protein n=1 Tax=Oryza punctata TaxID=4537 RepID=A0A0E0LIK1_ORYPU